MSVSDPESRYLTPWMYQQEAWRMEAFGTGDGSRLRTADGHPVTDFASGWVAANLGHGRAEITAAVTEQMQALAYAPPIFRSDIRDRLSRRLSGLSPWPDGGRLHLVSGGGQAMDDAIKLARRLTGRSKIMSAYRSYHGTCGNAAHATGDRRRWASEPGGAQVVRFLAPYPYRSPFHSANPVVECQRAIDHLQRILVQENPEEIAALIIEPVVGSSGLIVYPAGYLAAIRELTSRHGILLIFDEVMTGFGRVGAPFAATRFRVQPDMIIFGKGANNATLPLGGILLRECHARRFDSELLFDVGHTHAGHQVVAASMLAALDIYERDGLFERARSMETLMRNRLLSLQKTMPVIGDVRGLGAFWGVELVRDRETREPMIPWYGDPAGAERLTRILLGRGLWVYVRYGIIILAPPLVMNDEALAGGIDLLGEGLEEFCTSSASAWPGEE